MMNSKLLLVLILASLAVMFIAQNVAAVEIGFLFWKVSITSGLLIFFTLLLGMILGWSTHSYLLYRKSKDEYNYLR